MKTIIKYSLTTLICTQLWCAEYQEQKEFTNPNGTFKPEIAPECGIGRIDRDPMLYIEYDCPEHGPGCYHGKKIHFFGEHNIGKCSSKEARYAKLQNSRTITNDIRSALLDKDYFDTLVSEEKYKEAYQFSPNNSQGLLWKKQVLASLKKEIETLTLRSVYLEDETIDARLQTLLSSFIETEIYAEIENLYNLTKHRALNRKQTLLENPQLSVLAAPLQQQFISLMFGDLK